LSLPDLNLIEKTQTGRVLQIALNRPEKRNALNCALCGELVKALDEADTNHSVGAIVLSGNGPAFCAGMDLHEILEDDLLQLSGLHERLFTSINRLRSPIIAAVHGPALAGGTGLVANAHIAIAAPGVPFGLTEIKIGLWPVLVFRACELAMGERRTTELSITGRTFSAEEALLYGLVTEIAPDPLARAMQIAAAIADFSPIAMGAGLDYVHHIRVRNWDQAGKIGHQMRNRLMDNADFEEGIKAFLEKRKPLWPSLRE
jgi:enoyl-CoA hydratase/carnithine racemase